MLVKAAWPNMGSPWFTKFWFTKLAEAMVWSNHLDKQEASGGGTLVGQVAEQSLPTRRRCTFLEVPVKVSSLKTVVSG